MYEENNYKHTLSFLAILLVGGIFVFFLKRFDVIVTDLDYLLSIILLLSSIVLIIKMIYTKRFDLLVYPLSFITIIVIGNVLYPFYFMMSLVEDSLSVKELKDIGAYRWSYRPSRSAKIDSVEIVISEAYVQWETSWNSYNRNRIVVDYNKQKMRYRLRYKIGNREAPEMDRLLSVTCIIKNNACYKELDYEGEMALQPTDTLALRIVRTDYYYPYEEISATDTVVLYPIINAFHRNR